jgi:hypothetical protein
MSSRTSASLDAQRKNATAATLAGSQTFDGTMSPTTDRAIELNTTALILAATVVTLLGAAEEASAHAETNAKSISELCIRMSRLAARNNSRRAAESLIESYGFSIPMIDTTRAPLHSDCMDTT